MTNQKLPLFRPAEPNVKKVPTNRKEVKDDSYRVPAGRVEEVKTKVLAVIEDHHGQSSWNELRKATGASPLLLGIALKDLMKRRVITGPKTEYAGWEDIAQYHVKVRQQLKAA